MSDADDDLSGLKDEVNSLTETVSSLSEKVEGLADAEHQDDEHLVAVTGDVDEIKKQVADLQQQVTALDVKATGIDTVQQDILRYLQQLPLWWSLVSAAAGGHQITLPEFPGPPTT
jgi:archaellum component FlaC